MRGIIGMRVNEIIDKLHEADFYIYEEEATSIKFNHNFLNGCNLAISLDGEIDLIDDSTYNMKLALYNSNWEGTNLVSGVARIDDNDLSMDNFLRFAERVDRHINGIFSKQYYRCREYPTTITKIEPKEWEKNVVSTVEDILADNGYVANEGGTHYTKEVGLVTVVVVPPTLTKLNMSICLVHSITKKDVYYTEFTEENSKELLDKFDSYLKDLYEAFPSMDEIISSVSDYASKHL